MLGLLAATFKVASRTDDRPVLPSRDWALPEWPAASWSPPLHWYQLPKTDAATGD